MRRKEVRTERARTEVALVADRVVDTFRELRRDVRVRVRNAQRGGGRIPRDEAAEAAACVELRIVVAPVEDVRPAGLVDAVVDLDVEVVDRDGEIAGIAELRLNDESVRQVLGRLGLEAR